MVIQILLTLAIDILILIRMINKTISWFLGVNCIAIVSYNILGWTYTIKYLDLGGGSLGAVLLLIVITGIHLLITLIIEYFIESRKEESKNRQLNPHETPS
ncbi:MAG: hypothetical protein EOP47_01605 [Sphingobacteriaceae bacterium]|nr:MAG: hypothetical protein EOP47_01605 [Sphingobacteriaceae bacterium]